MSMMKIIEQTIVRTEGSYSYRVSEWALVTLIVVFGTLLRFWGLGNVGLHGDEETMAMPALAVLEQGGPYLPSGMFYPRALAQVYLMAASVWIFGESEWALRLPSALIGSTMPLLAFFLGRRFLTPRFNLVFIAVIAVLPVMIELAQTARMYVFWLAALMLFGSCVFRWERTNSLTSLTAAFVAWMIALHFHVLSILAAPIFLFPGLTKRSWSNLIQGAVVIGFCIIAYKLYGIWIDAQYPDSFEQPVREIVGALSMKQSPLQLYWAQYPWLLVGGVMVGLAVLVWSGLEVFQKKWPMAVARLLVGIGCVACAALHYHLGVLALFFGTVIWLRISFRPMRWLYAILGIVGAMAVCQAFVLYQTGEYPGRQLIGAMVGEASIWPILRFGEYSPVAFGLYALVFAYGVYKLATRQRIPDHMLFFSISVWAPLVAIGFFTWYLPPRYTAGALPFFLLCCVAGLEYLARQWDLTTRIGTRRQIVGAVMAVLLVFSIANPFEFVKVVNSGYDRHPDHKGAAEFIKDLPLTEDVIVIAEDILQQTYYLGEVDYWLRNFSDARSYVVPEDGQNLDQYTRTPLIGSGEELVRVLDENAGRRIFIIGSGEILPGQDEWARGRGIAEVLQSERLRVVYEGRDGITKVWVDGA